MDISQFKIPTQGVVVIWEWCWMDEVDHVSETSSEAMHELTASIDSVSGSEVTMGSPEPAVVHTITFKCIGCTRDEDSQKALKEISLKLDDEEEVKVRLQPEPENKFDSKAIAFQAFISDEWHRIGYIVKEALDDVHSALEQNAITSIEFAWAKYLITWTKSGPGYFAGVKITRKGKWSKEVCTSASTR